MGPGAGLDALEKILDPTGNRTLVRSQSLYRLRYRGRYDTV
jgi:hypothetical protein